MSAIFGRHVAASVRGTRIGETTIRRLENNPGNNPSGDGSNRGGLNQTILMPATTIREARLARVARRTIRILTTRITIRTRATGRTVLGAIRPTADPVTGPTI